MAKKRAIDIRRLILLGCSPVLVLFFFFSFLISSFAAFCARAGGGIFSDLFFFLDSFLLSVFSFLLLRNQFTDLISVSLFRSLCLSRSLPCNFLQSVIHWRISALRFASRCAAEISRGISSGGIALKWSCAQAISLSTTSPCSSGH